MLGSVKEQQPGPERVTQVETNFMHDFLHIPAIFSLSEMYPTDRHFSLVSLSLSLSVAVPASSCLARSVRLGMGFRMGLGTVYGVLEYFYGHIKILFVLSILCTVKLICS